MQKIRKENYSDFIKLFVEENSKVNLISKNDEKFLWEKHIFDSLSIEKFFNKYHINSGCKILDIGTGGGFPSIPIALTYPECTVTAVDSITKKINAVTSIKNKLNIKNLLPICSRVENIEKTFDIVVSRAVANLSKISEYALPKLKKNGYFIAYKSKKVMEEIHEANSVLENHKAKIIDIINYELPLEENIDRNLVIIQKNQ